MQGNHAFIHERLCLCVHVSLFKHVGAQNAWECTDLCGVHGCMIGWRAGDSVRVCVYHLTLQPAQLGPKQLGLSHMLPLNRVELSHQPCNACLAISLHHTHACSSLCACLFCRLVLSADCEPQRGLTLGRVGLCNMRSSVAVLLCPHTGQCVWLYDCMCSMCGSVCGRMAACGVCVTVCVAVWLHACLCAW